MLLEQENTTTQDGKNSSLALIRLVSELSSGMGGRDIWNRDLTSFPRVFFLNFPKRTSQPANTWFYDAIVPISFSHGPWSLGIVLPSTALEESWDLGQRIPGPNLVSALVHFRNWSY